MELPGRGHRATAAADISPGEVADRIVADARGPYAIYGHSLGARLAFETARELRRRGAPPPARLYVGAAHPPHLPEPLARIAHLTEDEFLDQLILRAGAPAAIRDHPDVVAALLPAIRADLAWLKAYRFRPEPPLATPVVAFAGTDDREVDAPVMLGWARHTTGGFRLHELVGDHMFLTSATDELTGLILADLAADPAAGPDLPPPAGDEAHLWLAPLDRLPAAGAATGELPAPVVARAAGLTDDRERRRYLGRRVVQRRLLRRYRTLRGLRAGLAYDDGTLLVGVGRDRRIGVGLRRLRAVTDPAGPGAALTPAEQAAVEAEPEEVRTATAMRLLAAKQAVLDAAGLAGRIGPDRVGFATAAGGYGARWWRPDPDPDPGVLADWRVTCLEAGGAVAALAVPAAGWRFRFELLTEAHR